MGQKMSGARLHGYTCRHILHAIRDEIFRHRGDERRRGKLEKANCGNMEGFDLKFAHFRDTITITTRSCSTLTSRLPVSATPHMLPIPQHLQTRLTVSAMNYIISELAP